MVTIPKKVKSREDLVNIILKDTISYKKTINKHKEE